MRQAGAVIIALALDKEGYLYAGTYSQSGGVYRYDISTTTATRDEFKVPTPQNRLDQNFPNPFNPTTTISFTTANKAFVSLTIFNILGERIVDLVSEELSPGPHGKKWDATRVPSGIYFCQLRVGNYTETKKLTVLK